MTLSARSGWDNLVDRQRDLQAASEQILINRSTRMVRTGRSSSSQVGRILAMATTPRMNLNEFWDYGAVYDNATEFNPAISMPYEPGSVFKILTMAAALDSGAVTPGTSFLDTGAIMVGGATIRNWNYEAWGPDMTGCLQHSLNVYLPGSPNHGLETFYGYEPLQARPSDRCGMAGEAAGRLKIPGDGDWCPVDLGTNAFRTGRGNHSPAAHDGRFLHCQPGTHGNPACPVCNDARRQAV
jgi:hypothetical protein